MGSQAELTASKTPALLLSRGAIVYAQHKREKNVSTGEKSPHTVSPIAHLLSSMIQSKVNVQQVINLEIAPRPHVTQRIDRNM